MKIIEKGEGKKISYSEIGNWLNIGDQLMFNLDKLEDDATVHIDVMGSATGKLRESEGVYYVAQIDIPPRAYTEEEIDNPDYDPETEGSQKKAIKRDPVPFSMDNVTLTLFTLKEGVFEDE